MGDGQKSEPIVVQSVSRSVTVNLRDSFEESRQPLEVGARLDQADDRHERLGVDQVIEGDIVEVELAGDGDQDAVERLSTRAR